MLLPHRNNALRLAMGAAFVAGILARLAVVGWSHPWEPHHPDEHILTLDAMALWEGITPQEVGWPGSTTRLVLSAAMVAQWVADEGRTAWQYRREPDRALDTVTTWIAERWVNPMPLYRVGRAISVVTGILQLVAFAWALSQWVGPEGTAIGTLAMAIAPLSVTYSQYVLADITGLLFVTILIGLAANPTPRRVIAMGALVGLALSSKFHFGLWLLTPVLCAWLGRGADFARKWRLSLFAVGAALWVVLTLVPWFLINPLLQLKEFAGVVLVKIGEGAPLWLVPDNIYVLFSGFGILSWLGALLGLGSIGRTGFRKWVPMLMPLVLGTILLIKSATVFDRYGLALLPGAALLSALGWESLLLKSRGRPRIVAAAALAVCVLMTISSLVSAERTAGEADVDVLAKEWIMTHVARGRRIAVYDESNAFLPRTAEQLRRCVEYVETPAAYREKWHVENVTDSESAQPMRSVVLNDELYHAYWCRRELDVQRDPGFYVVPYHEEPRYGAVLEREALNDFRIGSTAATGGIDVLVANRSVAVGLLPAHVIERRRGRRLIYVR
jgi:hypothetical protein